MARANVAPVNVDQSKESVMFSSFKPKVDEKMSCCSTNTASCEVTTRESEGCCSPKPKGKTACPQCKEKAKGVLSKTLDSLLIKDAKAKLETLEGFYYCKTSTCKVVYFKDEIILTQEDVSVTVGLKEGASPATLCYCFGWSKEKIKEQIEASGTTNALEDIKAKMENPGCSCETLNPSGRCCLGDVGQAIKVMQES